jgi:hypothetical protein
VGEQCWKEAAQERVKLFGFPIELENDPGGVFWLSNQPSLQIWLQGGWGNRWELELLKVLKGR